MLATGCGGRVAPPPAPNIAAFDGARGPEIQLSRLTAHVWRHVSAAEVPGYGRVEANGLIVVGRRGAVVVDTAWTPAQTQWLIDRVRAATGHPPVAMVATHFHDDRAGGVGTAHAAGIPVYATALTRTLLGDAGAAIDHPFDRRATIELGDVDVELFFPGAGHTRDNSVVYVAGDRLLFGGCLIRAATTDWIGNTADADLGAWPETMDRLIHRYRDAAIVVPGHGRPGDASLLPHTRQLAVGAAGKAR